MAEVASLVAGIVGDAHVLAGDEVPSEYSHDEALGVDARMPAYVAAPASAGEVAAILNVATAHRLPVTARGGGTGMSGAAVPRPGGIVVSFERMDAIVEIDTVNHVAVVDAGDGNVHLAVFQPDRDLRSALLRGLFTAGLALGGTISGEHGIGVAKQRYFLELTDPVKDRSDAPDQACIRPRRHP